MPIEIESPEEMGYANIDCNLMESSFSDAALQDLDLDLNNLVLCYGSHRGKPELREMIASGSHVSPEDVLITAGAAAALFIVSTSLLKSGDRIVVARPNYATNIETPRAIGASIEFMELSFEQNFRIDLDSLAEKLTPETNLVSLTFPHNPTGSTLTLNELHRLIGLIESRNVLLILDETYREMAFSGILPNAAELSPKVISVSSLSKTYGLPGIRTGWLSCRNPDLMQLFLAAKEQIMICNSVVDEEIAFQFLEKKERYLPLICEKIESHFRIMKNWIESQNDLEWVEPTGGVVCFPRIKAECRTDAPRFYRILNERYKTFVGPGHWFEMDPRYMRIGYGWPKTDELLRGLQNISLAVSESLRAL